MATPHDRLYSREHEWVLQEGKRALVGITDHAQEQLGDVIFVQLPPVDSSVTAGEPMGEAESTKTVSDIYSPVTGVVRQLNEELEGTPDLVNEDPYGRGWLVAIEVSKIQEDLMTADEYDTFLEQEDQA